MYLQDHAKPSFWQDRARASCKYLQDPCFASRARLSFKYFQVLFLILALSCSILLTLAHSCSILLNLTLSWSWSILLNLAKNRSLFILQVLARSSCSILHMMGLECTYKILQDCRFGKIEQERLANSCKYMQDPSYAR